MTSTTRSEEPIISNSYVKCYSDHLVIHLYYFPVGDKTIKYKQWGMALPPI